MRLEAMKWTCGVALLLLMLASPAHGQRRGFGGGIARGGASFRGSVGGFRGSSYGSFRGASYGGFRGGSLFGYRGGYGRGFRYGFGRYGYGGFRYRYWPYYGYYGLGFGLGWPFYGSDWSYPYYGSYGYASYDGYAGAPYGGAGYASAPPVVINQTYAPETLRPQVREYAPPPEASAPAREYVPPSPPPEAKPLAATASYYLIAMPNGSVTIAVAYWTRGNMLHFVTRDKAEHELPMTGIDRELTDQLNRERGVEFRIPR